MSMNIPSVAAGAVAGALAGDAYDKAKDKAAGAAGASTIEHGPIEFHMLVDIAANIEKMIHDAKAAACPPLISPVQIIPSDQSGSMPFVLARRAYKHVSLLSATAFTAMCNTPLGVINFSMNVGWNAFDLPDGTRITAQGANAVKVQFYYGDDAIDITGV